MKYESLNLPKNCDFYSKRIDSIREVYKSIKFETLFEPTQLRIQEKGKKMNVEITNHLDLIAWQKEIAYSSVVKMHTVENSIYNSIKNKDLYSMAILLRHHMENAGLLALAVEILIESLDKENFEVLNRFISKTWFGSAFYNKPLFRDSEQAFLSIETVTISAMVNALDKFLATISCDQNEEPQNIFNNNYTLLCQIAHPNSASSCFFTKTKKVKNGTNVTFTWNGNYQEDEGLYRFMNMLYYNMTFGLANYYIFMSHQFTEDMEVIQNMEMVDYAYHQILNRFNDKKNFA
jgi:hypothetical protein